MAKRSNVKKVVLKETEDTKPIKEKIKIDTSVIASQIKDQLTSFHDTLEDALRSNKPNRFVVTNDGVVQVTSNKIGTFIAKTKKIPGAQKIDDTFKFNLPKKIPYNIFLQVLSFFRAVCEKFDDAEAAVQIFWDENKQDYFIHCPKQTIGKATVDFERDPDMEEKYLLVMDIHSHNTMGAFFSGTDDKDEKETRLYGVLGKVKDAKPEYKFRAMCGGNAIDLDIWDVFENPYSVVDFPETWFANLEEEKKIVTSKWENKGTWASNKVYGLSTQKDLYEDYYHNYYRYNIKDEEDDIPVVSTTFSKKNDEKKESKALLNADCHGKSVTVDDILDAIALMDEDEVMDLMLSLANDGYDVFMEKILYLKNKW